MIDNKKIAPTFYKVIPTENGDSLQYSTKNIGKSLALTGELSIHLSLLSINFLLFNPNRRNMI